MSNKSVPGVVVVALVAAVAIGFGNAVADLLTVVGGAVIAFFGVRYHSGKVAEYRDKLAAKDAQIGERDARIGQLQTQARMGVQGRTDATELFLEEDDLSIPPVKAESGRSFRDMLTRRS